MNNPNDFIALHLAEKYKSTRASIQYILHCVEFNWSCLSFIRETAGKI
jgi:hypothetical protein